MSMKLKINGDSNMEITDDNKTIVSSDIAKEICDNTIIPDDEKNWKSPKLQIKDNL